MGLFKRSKKEIPAELPDLALDQEHGDSQGLNPSIAAQNSPPRNTPQFPTQRYIEVAKPKEKPLPSEDEDKGFFKDLINNLIQEQKNVEKMESFYNNRFAAEDLVHQMREYWEEQKPELLLKNVGSDLKAKMAEKTERLHKLEKEWQDVYFALLSKEDEIRTEEKELKETISEFITICKKAVGKKSRR